MLQHLPDDIQQRLLESLGQREHASLSAVSPQLRDLCAPYIWRRFRCVTCRTLLFRPRELASGEEKGTPTTPMVKMPSSRLPRRSFSQLRPRVLSAGVGQLSLGMSIHEAEGGTGKDVRCAYADEEEMRKEIGVTIDKRAGAANFHVLRHLAQTMYTNERFPLRRELSAVHALRCHRCGVFVGFRKATEDGQARDFIHHDFVELIDINGDVRTLSGEVISRAKAWDIKGAVRCSNPTCDQILFEREDVLPWAHVLSSTRLTDLDAYLEWDHSWAGAATASHPAFFVKRLRRGSFNVGYVRFEHLRQGDMEVGDVSCSQCGTHIGWRFLAEVPQHDSGLLRNYDQVGRYGIIRAACTPSEPRLAV